MDILSNIWGFILLFFWAFIFISALFVVFSVVSDLIRDKLAALGITVKDTKEGSVWEKG